MCHSISEDLVVLVVWAIGFGIIAVYVAALTWLDNRLERKDSNDASAKNK